MDMFYDESDFSHGTSLSKAYLVSGEPAAKLLRIRRIPLQASWQPRLSELPDQFWKSQVSNCTWAHVFDFLSLDALLKIDAVAKWPDGLLSKSFDNLRMRTHNSRQDSLADDVLQNLARRVLELELPRQWKPSGDCRASSMLQAFIRQARDGLVVASRYGIAQQSKYIAALFDDFPIHCKVGMAPEKASSGDRARVRVLRGDALHGFDWAAGIHAASRSQTYLLEQRCYCQLNASRGDEFELVIALQRGDYDMKLYIGRAPRGGILHLELEGIRVAEVDFFAARKSTSMEFHSLSLTVPSTGLHSLRFRVKGKRPQSQGYRWYVNHVAISAQVPDVLSSLRSPSRPLQSSALQALAFKVKEECGLVHSFLKPLLEQGLVSAVFALLRQGSSQQQCDALAIHLASSYGGGSSGPLIRGHGPKFEDGTGMCAHCEEIVNLSSVPFLLELIRSGPHEVRTRATVLISNLVADRPSIRDLVLRSGVVSAMEDFLRKAESVHVARLVLNLSRGDQFHTCCATNSAGHRDGDWGHMVIEHTLLLLPVLVRLLSSQDAEVLRHACWAVGYLATRPDSHRAALVEARVCERILELISHPAAAVQKAAVIALGIITSGEPPDGKNACSNAWPDRQHRNCAAFCSWSVVFSLKDKFHNKEQCESFCRALTSLLDRDDIRVETCTIITALFKNWADCVRVAIDVGLVSRLVLMRRAEGIAAAQPLFLAAREAASDLELLQKLRKCDIVSFCYNMLDAMDDGTIVDSLKLLDRIMITVPVCVLRIHPWPSVLAEIKRLASKDYNFYKAAHPYAKRVCAGLDLRFATAAKDEGGLSGPEIQVAVERMIQQAEQTIADYNHQKNSQRNETKKSIEDYCSRMQRILDQDRSEHELETHERDTLESIMSTTLKKLHDNTYAAELEELNVWKTHVEQSGNGIMQRVYERRYERRREAGRT